MNEDIKAIKRSHSKGGKTLILASRILEWAIFLVLILIFVILLSPVLPTKKLGSIYIVVSGSMEPVIQTGSVALVEPVTANQVKQGDIVTFTSPEDPKETVIHRVVEVDKNPDTEVSFFTKGDNNNTRDNWTILGSSIKGKYVLSVPYIGYAASAIRTKIGFGVLIGIPAILLLLLQFKKIKEGIEEEVQKRTEKAISKASREEKTPIKNTLSMILTLVIIGTLVTIGGSFKIVRALFSSEVFVSGLTLKAANLPHVSRTNVVINEIMWAGSTASSSDEWIELRNMTNQSIDLTNWQLLNVAKGSGSLKIDPSRAHIIPGNGYFLIANYDATNSSSALNVQADIVDSSLSFNNDYAKNGPVILEDADNTIIDETPPNTSSAWPAGFYQGASRGLHQSMERNTDPGDGTTVSNWHTCTDAACTSIIFWDTRGNNYGTPGRANQSPNDPTSNNPSTHPSPDNSKIKTLDLTQPETTLSATPTPDLDQNQPSSPSADISKNLITLTPTVTPTDTPTQTPSVTLSPSPTLTQTKSPAT